MKITIDKKLFFTLFLLRMFQLNAVLSNTLPVDREELAIIQQILK